jgi:putative protein kinase ArgK-like GTPase of G3E family
MTLSLLKSVGVGQSEVALSHMVDFLFTAHWS